MKYFTIIYDFCFAGGMLSTLGPPLTPGPLTPGTLLQGGLTPGGLQHGSMTPGNEHNFKICISSGNNSVYV